MPRLKATLLLKILWACQACMGVGQRLIPKADPAKVLP